MPSASVRDGCSGEDHITPPQDPVKWREQASPPSCSARIYSNRVSVSQAYFVHCINKTAHSNFYAPYSSLA